MKRIFSSLIIFLSLTSSVFAQKILIPMDLDQSDHLKAYVITFWALAKYDWLHLHHEDFTGQYGKFFASSRNQPWYQSQVRDLEAEAKKLGYSKVSDMKKTVARRIKEYVANGGYMFAMCSATDSYDI